MEKPNHDMKREDGITVLLTCYNDAVFLEKSIRSILNQTYSNFEFLIIDDGSTDETEHVVRSFKDERIVYQKTDHKGRAHALNFGLKIASGYWVAVIDADDWAHPFRLEKQIQFLNNNPETDILSCWYAIHDGNKILYPIKSLTTHPEIKKRFLLSSDIVHSGVIYRKEKIVNGGGYRETSFEDYDLWLRLSDSCVFRNIPEVLMFVLVRYDSRSRNNLLNQYRDHYNTMEFIYSDKGFERFEVNAKNEQTLYCGWREYFYGSKTEARKYWRLLGLSIIKEPRIWLAFFISFLPENWFVMFKEFRWKFRLSYFIHYFTEENKEIRNSYRSLFQ